VRTEMLTTHVFMTMYFILLISGKNQLSYNIIKRLIS